MTAVLVPGVRQEQAALGTGGKVTYSSAHLPGQVSVIAVGPPGRNPAGAAAASA